MNYPSANPKSTKPTIFISDSDVASLADWDDVIAALEDAYSREIKPAMVPPRVLARGDGFWLRSLCAVSPSGEYMGCKLIAAHPFIKRASYLISLFDQRTMALAALIDGNRITDIRTASAAALAVDRLSVDRPLSVTVIGSGAVARGQLSALLAVRAVSSIKVFSPTPTNREKFAEEFRKAYAIDINAVASAREAVSGADVVMCAARSRDESPVLSGEWIQPGTVVVSIGSTLPEQREVDVETMRRASRIVADMPEEVVRETGDSLAAHKEGIDVETKTVSLGDVVAGRVAGRQSAEEIILYKSVGAALQDIVTAEVLMRKALAENRYTSMPESVVTIDR